MVRPPLTRRAEQPLLLALPVALLDGRALVVRLLALSEAELNLGPATGREVEGEGHQRHALTPDRAGQPRHLAPAQQELPRAPRLVVEAVAAVVLGYVGVEQPKLAAHLGRVRLADCRAAFPQRL